MAETPKPLERLVRDCVQLLEHTRELARKPPEDAGRRALVLRAMGHVEQALADVVACTRGADKASGRRLSASLGRLRERAGAARSAISALVAPEPEPASPQPATPAPKTGPPAAPTAAAPAAAATPGAATTGPKTPLKAAVDAALGAAPRADPPAARTEARPETPKASTGPGQAAQPQAKPQPKPRPKPQTKPQPQPQPEDESGAGAAPEGGSGPGAAAPAASGPRTAGGAQSLEHVFAQLARAKSTGMLRVQHAGTISSFHLHRGLLIGAASSRLPEDCSVEQILVEQGTLDAERLRTLKAQIGRRYKDLVTALVVNHVVSEPEMRAALALRLGRLAERAINASRGTYAFHAGRVEQVAVPVRLTLEQALNTVRDSATAREAAEDESREHLTDVEHLRRQLDGMHGDRPTPKLRTRPK